MKRISDRLLTYFPYIFSLVYFILLLFMETSVFHAIQNRSFLMSHEFFQPYLKYSGGLMDYLGLFFSEILRFNLSGAILYAVTLLASILLYKSLLRKTGVSDGLLLITLYPFIFLLLLTFNFFHPISINLKLLFGLFILHFLLFSSDKGYFVKILSYIALVGCWYLCGLEFFILVLTYWLIHTVVYRRVLQNSPVMLLAVISVALLNTFVFYTPVSASIKSVGECASEIPFILPFTYLLIVISPLLARIKQMRRISPVLHFLMILGFGTILSFLSYSRDDHITGRVMVAGINNDYDEVLQLGNDFQPYSKIVSAYTNIALLNKGRILDKMFTYNQVAGIEGLLPSDEFNGFNAFSNMKACFEIGLMNQTVRWTMEAISKFDHNAEILKHLVLAHLINGNIKASDKYYAMYKTTIFNRKDKRWLGTLLEDYKNEKYDDYILEKVRLMPRYDFFSGNRTNRKGFSWVIEADYNKKAFEMFIAMCLLENDYEGVKKLIVRFRAMGYNKLPIHVQEAICLGEAPADLYNYQIEPHIFQNCAWFYETLRRYGNDLQAARKELYNKAGDTYWYYLHYVKSVTEK